MMSSQVVSIHAGDYAENLFLEYDGEIYKYRNRLVTLSIDGTRLETGDMPAVLIEDSETAKSHTLVPVREVFESRAIGGQVKWDTKNQEILVTYGETTVELKIDSNIARVNGEEIPLDMPAKLIRDRNKDNAKTMIPLRFVSENLGFNVDWDQESYTALISTFAMKAPNDGVDDGQLDGDGVIEEGNKVEDDLTPSKPDNLDEELVERIDGNDAKRPLPTALFDNPIVFEGDVEGEIRGDIVREKHSLAYIKDVDFDMDDLFFTINVDGQITDIEDYMWDGKYILEVENADFDRASMNIDYQRNPIADEIRMGRHSDESGVAFGKIVFDLKESGYQFTVSLNDDRNQIFVKPMNSSVANITLGQNESGDFVEIGGVNARGVKAFRLSKPSRIVFDIPNTITPFGYQEADASGQYVTNIRTSQFDATTTRIVLEVDGQPDYEIIELDGETTRVQIKEPDYEHIAYDRTDDIPTVTIEKDIQEVNGVKYTDRYQDREYIITIPGDYRSHFGSGLVKINDGIIDNINVKLNASGDTEVTIKTATIHEFRVEEDEKGIAIKAYKPKELYEKIIVIDAGHGGNDPGALAAGGKFYEKDINLGVTLELKKLLDQHPDMKVYYTRISDVRPSLEERCILANEVEADFFLSIHSNTFAQTSYRGTETLYLPGKDTPGLNAFELADVVQRVFTANTLFPNYKIKQRDNLYVLNGTNMPAVILEMGYMSNPEDLKILTDKSYHDEIAKGIELSILETFRLYPTGR
jgi:N-acetylmuramoyl-L-alanine amidase